MDKYIFSKLHESFDISFQLFASLRGFPFKIHVEDGFLPFLICLVEIHKGNEGEEGSDALSRGTYRYG